MKTSIPVLIIAFKRHTNLKKIFEICIESGITNFYVAIDGPRNDSDLEEISLVRNVLDEVKLNPKLTIRSIIRNQNVGCSASVISACSWFFTTEKFGVVFEDDCIPDKTFFEFVSDSKKILDSDSTVFSSGGLQLSEDLYLAENAMVLCDYAFFWGWATTQEKWFEILKYIIEHPPTFKSFLKSLRSKEEMFWFAGFRRAYMGYMDVWDTLFTYTMLSLKLRSILPGKNLITNVGNDIHATHSALDIHATNRRTHSYLQSSVKPNYFPALTKYFESDYFKIKPRHRITVIFTYIVDCIYPHRKEFEVLSKRINQSMVYLNKS